MKKRKIIVSSGSESEPENIEFCDESDGLDDEDIMKDEFIFDEIGRNPVKLEYVLVEFLINKQKVYYAGQILTDINEQNEYDVSFMRKDAQNKNRFVYPNVPDFAVVAACDIKMVLPKPQHLGSTSRQKSAISFAVDFSCLHIR